MQIRNNLLNLFFPNRCPGCNKILTASEDLCETCSEHTLLTHDSYCQRCGKEACICKRAVFAYDRAVVCCRYADEAAAAVVRMKTSENTNFAHFAARILAERIRFSLNFGTFDCVMPVPMHPSHQRERGYNQAALIGREIARLLSLPYREDVLYKEKSVVSQHSLGAKDRKKNVAGFGIRDIRLDGLRILLCDDVLTTGATLDRCAALLKQNGAAAVVAAAAASTPPKDYRKSEETAPLPTEGGTS